MGKHGTFETVDQVLYDVEPMRALSEFGQCLAESLQR